MGNPSITPQNTEPAEFRISPENGMLAFVPGDLIAAAIKSLPRPEPEAQSPRVVPVEVPGYGLVNITLEIASYRHRKDRYWSWRPVRADQRGQDSTSA